MNGNFCVIQETIRLCKFLKFDLINISTMSFRQNVVFQNGNHLFHCCLGDTALLGTFQELVMDEENQHEMR